METADWIEHLQSLTRQKTVIQVIVGFEGGGINLTGRVLEASVATIRFGGEDYELTLDPSRIVSVIPDEPFESRAPGGGKARPRRTRSFEVNLANGDRAAVYELAEQPR